MWDLKHWVHIWVKNRSYERELVAQQSVSNWGGERSGEPMVGCQLGGPKVPDLVSQCVGENSQQVVAH